MMMLRSLALIIFIACCVTTFAQKSMYFSFDEQSGTPSALEAISNTEYPIKNNFNKPERIAGVSGNALRFDGWSTWIEKENVSISGTTRKMTVACWYATESFTAANSAIISQENATSGFTLEVEPFGKVVFIFWADNTRYVLVTDNTLERYQWNHIVATIDLDSKSSAVYVNGNKWKDLVLAEHNAISLSQGKMYIGRDTDQLEFAGFPLTTINGALDELSIYAETLSPLLIAERYNLHNDVVVDLTIDPDVRHAGDHLRPRYHAMPNTSWTNECYGLTYYNGTYHLFFQKNPNGPYLYFMHWGHLTSPDLVNWKEEKIALAPSPGFDSFGVWSGTTIKNDQGKPVIFYTGVNGVKAGIGLAESTDEDLIHWEESPSNPVIEGAPAEIKHRDFRDPFVWKHGDSYYMIVGSGLQFGGGGYLFTYKSSNLTNWTRIDALYNDTNVERSGDFWEMPFFYQLTEKDWMLSVTPLPVNGVRARAVYWIGAFENEKFVPYDPAPKSLELISDNLLAPAVGTDIQGRNIYTGIIPEDRNVGDQVKAGWRHLFSLPRVLRMLNDSTVGQTPHPNLCRLRKNEVCSSNRVVATGTEFNLSEFQGNQAELNFVIDPDSASAFSIHVLKNQDKSELTAINFDLSKNLIKLDRTLSSQSLTAKDVREVKYVFDHKENINVTIFIDHSVLEVFIDNIVVFSCRVYPSKAESTLVDIIAARSNLKLLSFCGWNLNDMKTSSSTQVCEPDPSILPDALRKEPAVKNPIMGINDNGENNFDAFPNPARNELLLRYSAETAYLEIYSLTGTLVRSEIITDHKVSVDDLVKGVYFFKVNTDKQSKTMKILIE